MSRWVADAGPLIFLAKLGRLDLLAGTGDNIYIPSAVMVEIRAKADEACQRVEEVAKTWLQIQELEFYWARVSGMKSRPLRKKSSVFKRMDSELLRCWLKRY